MTSSGLPGGLAWQPWRLLHDLAPGGVYRAGPIAGAAVVSYTTLSPLPAAAGGFLSVALARGSLRVGVTHHRARGSPDFPRGLTSRLSG